MAELAPDDDQLALHPKCVGKASFAYSWGLRWKTNVMRFNQLPHPSIRMHSNIEL